jgi:hypothetical protein
LLGAPNIEGRGSAWAGGGGGESKRRQISPLLAKIHKNGAEKRLFPALLVQSPKTPFFAQKYLIRYTPKTFFEE